MELDCIFLPLKTLPLSMHNLINGDTAAPVKLKNAISMRYPSGYHIHHTLRSGSGKQFSCFLSTLHEQLCLPIAYTLFTIESPQEMRC